MVAHHVLVVMSKGFNNIFETLYFEKIVFPFKAHAPISNWRSKSVKVLKLHETCTLVMYMYKYTHIT